MFLKRRRFLLAAAAGGGLAGCGFSLEQGLWNPCYASLPRRLAAHELVQSAWQGIDARQVWDSHVHLVGIGDSGSGIELHPRMHSLLSPAQFARRLFFLNAGCAHEVRGDVDRAYIERMHNLVDGMRGGVKLLLFAFERAYREDGTPDAGNTGLHVPDAYARDTARAHPAYFEWAASIHPYRADCVDAAEWAARNGARAVKWLPASMGMDPAAPRCDRFYEALARLGLPLIVHAGEERAVLGADAQDLGNPLRLRRALALGVRVVVAHCGSLGQDRDLDRGAGGPVVDSFELFARMMDEPRHAGRLFGDISAVTQLNRAGPALARLIERKDWHARLLNGSDYPLPGVMPIFSVDYLVSIGLLAAAAAPVLREIRAHNPLLFDFVLKRTLRSNGKAFAAGVFETRGFFERARG
ncbi:MAG: amidohydrolase [Betaproteobacteria bacterium]|nr:MAG: amidohydrolase [Betaproteobacteria bacterium]